MTYHITPPAEQRRDTVALGRRMGFAPFSDCIENNGTLLRDIRRFCDRTDMPITLFGRKAVNDPRLVGDMSNGRILRPKTVRRIRAFMETVQ